MADEEDIDLAFQQKKLFQSFSRQRLYFQLQTDSTCKNNFLFSILAGKIFVSEFSSEMADRQSNQSLESKQWYPGQLIYDYDTPSFHAFLIIEGSVEIYSKKGLKLNTLYDKEIFGESSLLLNKKRSVAAIAGENGASAHLIPKEHLTSLQEQAPLLAAILRKVQLRLEDSNNQSAELAKQIEVILKLVKTQKETNKAVEERLEQIMLNIQESFRTD